MCVWTETPKLHWLSLGLVYRRWCRRSIHSFIHKYLGGCWSRLSPCSGAQGGWARWTSTPCTGAAPSQVGRSGWPTVGSTSTRITSGRPATRGSWPTDSKQSLAGRSTTTPSPTASCTRTYSQALSEGRLLKWSPEQPQCYVWILFCVIFFQAT